MFGDFRYLFYYKRPTSALLPFDIEIEITLSKLKRVKVDIIRMVENNNYRYNEGHSDQNEILEMREPTFGDFWRSLLNENYLRIRHQSIDANNFELKPALISMVQQQQFKGNPLEDPNGHLSNSFSCVVQSK